MPAPHGSLPVNLTGDDEDPSPHHHQLLPKQFRPQDQAKVEAEEENEVEEDDAYDSEGSPSATCQEMPEFIYVQLSEIHNDVCCPICLGIIKKTRTVMECLHRFCRECIDKSMRMGSNECPVCQTYCASQHSLRDDPNYDALIAALYPDIQKHEEEKLALQEEEGTPNEQTFVEAMSNLDLNKQRKEKSNSAVKEDEKYEVIDLQAEDHVKKSTGVVVGVKRYCQGDNCTADLSEAKKYHKKLRVCDHHSKAQVVLVSGLRQRFCQQCSRFHEVSEFEDTKRSCRRRLAGHNARRRKNPAESHTEGSSCNGRTGTQLKDVGGQVDDTGRIRYIEDFVSGHFRNRAHNILVACKAYTEGGYFGRICHPGNTAQSAEGNSSRQFKSTLPTCLFQISPKMNQQTGSSFELDPKSHRTS